MMPYKDYTASVTKAVGQSLDEALNRESGRDANRRSAGLDACLDRLFSPRQKDLIFKKLSGESFTKTEREYYSRVVRKKLLAIANSQVSDIANKLTRK